MNLLEAYKNRLAISESVYQKNHMGQKMDSSKKLAVAKCLQNISNFMNEAFDSSTGTQRSDMGMFKKFCLNLTTVALPNLIAHELVIVHPMASMSGYITYIEYTASTTKGGTTQGDLLNNPFKLGDVDSNYTSARVVENVTAYTEGDAVVGKLAWAPVYTGDAEDAQVKVTTKTGQEIEGLKFTVDSATGVITFTAGNVKADDELKVAYVYDNVVIPQNNLPMLKAEMKSLPLIAKARRIAVYYSQIAAFQAKTDYGVDLGDQLAEKAVGQLSYEIDTEITQLLIDNAAEDAELTWNKAKPYGISKAEHYEGFTEMIEIGRQKIYDRTKRFAPNYMLIASDVLPVLTFIKGWQAAPAGQINGPYFAGTLNGLKVFVTPNIAASTFVIGVNGDDMMSSAAVYAPYMAIVPTQLLQYADGGTSQGWSTMYDLRILNKDLLVKGKLIVDTENAG